MTGSELVRGDRTDLNGPFVARATFALGLEPARITIVGDEPGELRRALREGLEADLCVVTGGLGPTHDDRTVELLGEVTCRPPTVDPALEAEIGALSRAFAERLGRPYSDFEPGVRKQASLPRGSHSLGLAGTAPGIVLEHRGCVVVVLPGPPRELQRLWPRAVESPLVRTLLARAEPPDLRILRFFGVSESAVATALAAAGGDGEGVEVTICARDFEIHVDLVVEPGAGERATELAGRLGASLEHHLFAHDERPIEELVLELCRAGGLTLATAESCTGGMVASRLTGVAGSSDVFEGAIVAYADAVKHDELGVDEELLRVHGAVSAEVARAMSGGARRALGADVAVAVTGIAGPDGGTPEKPVGLVHLHASGAGRRACRRLQPARRPRDDPPARDRDGAPPRAAPLDTERAHTCVSLPASVEGHAFPRLFCALRLPAATLDVLEAWQSEHLSGRVVLREHVHVTLAFLGRTPAAGLEAVGGELRRSAAATGGGIVLRARRYRETGSVGMIELEDVGARSARLAATLHEGLERLGVYRREQRPWLPHLTVLRFRRRPGLHPPLPELGAFSPSEAAVYHSVLRPTGAQYEVLESYALGG